MKFLRHNLLLFLILVVVLGSSGCVARTHKVKASERPKPAKNATLAELIQKVNQQSELIKSYQAKVRFELRSGSLSSGELKDYHEIRGFLLYRAPDHLRMIGQIPSFGLNALDMVSDGREFRVAFAPYKKFVVGSALDRPHSVKPLENLRPAHILEVLRFAPIPPVDARHFVFLEEDSEGRDNYYVLNEVTLESGSDAQLHRKIWIDRADLNVARQQLYSEGGVLESDARYTGYTTWEGTNYPQIIDYSRPRENYGLTTHFDEIKFNLTLDDSKFELERPEGYELIEVGKKPINP